MQARPCLQARADVCEAGPWLTGWASLAGGSKCQIVDGFFGQTLWTVEWLGRFVGLRRVHGVQVWLAKNARQDIRALRLPNLPSQIFIGPYRIFNFAED